MEKKKPTPALIINGSQADHLGLGSILVDVTVQINSLILVWELYMPKIGSWNIPFKG